MGQKDILYYTVCPRSLDPFYMAFYFIDRSRLSGDTGYSLSDTVPLYSKMYLNMEHKMKC